MEPKELLKIDHRICTGEAGKPESAAEMIYQAVTIEPNARNAEFLAATNPDLLLPSIRSHMLRGDLENAEQKIQRLAQDSDDTAQVESLMEAARLAGFRAQWNRCREICDRALTLTVEPIDQLSILQMRSVALLELGNLKGALNDVEMVLSQATKFPQAVAVGYCKVQRLRILIRTVGPQAVRREIEELWRESLSTSNFNLDQVLANLRLELDARRLEGGSLVDVALACMRLADTIGDRQYEGLAVLDLVMALAEPHPVLLNMLNSFSGEFERVKFLMADAQLAEPQTASGRAIKSSRREHRVIDSLPRQKYILLRRPGVWLDLTQRTATTLSGNLQWLNMSERLAQGEVDKKEFFETVWEQKFSLELHDGVLRTFCSRLKSKFGIQLKRAEGRLSFEDTLVI